MNASAAQLKGTAIAPWGGDPKATGRRTIDAGIPERTLRTLAGIAADSHYTTEQVLLTVHMRVLRAITGESTVSTCFRDAVGGQSCTLTLPDGSWRSLIDAAADCLREAGPADHAWATVLDVDGGPPDPACILHLAWGHCRLTLSYRPEVLGDEMASRIAGYYRAVMRAIADNPEAAHHTANLLSAEEARELLHDRVGPPAPGSDRLFLERFRDQVAASPDAVAVVHGERRWTYGELDERSDRVARLLRTRGLVSEGVVATVLDRTAEWVAAIIGIFKAGGVYLPIRPDFPAARIESQLDRSDCRLVLTATGDELPERLPCPVLTASDVEGAVGGDVPEVHIGPEHAAYIYFTSGSTGLPKGAVCEQAGMINHMLAKIDDLQLKPGENVVQSASQCFDISLWQALAPLLTGGATILVDDATQRDVSRFLGLLAEGGIHVIQVVPSYLDAMLVAAGEYPIPLGDLRCVSVTGEAFKRELARRWLRTFPHIPVLNAYGLTETSDDTLHALFRELPALDLPVMPIGRPVRHVYPYVLDEHLRLAPTGAPGEMAFSGVCVGRGYVNDPQRSAEVFVDDPFRPGLRMYRTGDIGRWLSDGSLEFLGRRDEQVKVNGYRVELGEVENQLLRIAGVAEAAVVVAGQSGDDRRLAGFYAGDPALTAETIRERLGETLPGYMIPAEWHRLESLPLNENSKVDKRRLAGLALERGAAETRQPLKSAQEKAVAAVWAEIIGIDLDRIGREDDFFELGGTSLSAVRLVVRLGRGVTLTEVIDCPVLHEMAALLEAD